VTTSTPETLEGPAAVSNQRDRMIAGVSALLLLIGMPVGWLTDNPSTSDVIGMIVAIVIDLALMAGVFLWLLPRERAATHRTARTALIMGIVSILLGGVFWTGLVFGVGAGAVALGLTVRERGPSRMATVGLGLGAFAAVASFVLLLVG
jgi:hypothetical protein